MLGLNLRDEFQGKRLKGTAIDLANEANTGATQVSAADFLEITYPSGDLMKAIEAIGPGQARPLVLIGDRGIGKSHMMGALHHTLTSPDAVRSWLGNWSLRMPDAKVTNLPLRESMFVISEGMQRHRVKFLWDLLFGRHPKGEYFKGKWEAMGDQKTHVPPDTLIIEMLHQQPVALLLDEYQTWYDGLIDTKQQPYQKWAFNFIQTLTGIAKDHPDLLVLVASVRNGTTDAYQQIHRESPVIVDFKGPGAERDRRRLLLHRLFSNRLQIAEDVIDTAIAPNLKEFLRLTDAPPSDHAKIKAEFVETWPYAPHLMRLLEDQVLVATDAQETRDLIRILADLYKRRGDKSQILTAADFRIDDEGSGITALLDSVANRHHANLRDHALRNLTAVKEASRDPDTEVPHLDEIISALWLRSLATGNHAGATGATLHVDITRSKSIDDNTFDVELSTIEENSFNIHHSGDRLVFREEENPQAKLLASARNDRQFTDGSDKVQLAKQLRYVLTGTDDVERSWRVIVLAENWLTTPWAGVDESDLSDRWDGRQFPHIVLPESPAKLDPDLGRWLRDQVAKRRNIPRFLIPKADLGNMYRDRELLVMARAILKAEEWKDQAPEYGKFKTKYEKELRGILKQRFDRFAVLRTWDYGSPENCEFQVERIEKQGAEIPKAIEEVLKIDVFVPEDFEAHIVAAAAANRSVGALFGELQEPRPNQEACVPWLGETVMKEKVLRLCAKGKIAVNNRDTELLLAAPGEDEETAWQRLRGKLGTGSHLDEAKLLLPQAVPASGGAKPAAAQAMQPAVASGTSVQSGGAGGTATVSNGDRPATAAPEGGTPPNLFNGGATERKYVSQVAPATSPLNLIGKAEAWGIQPGTPLQEIKVRIEAGTGAQLKALLKALPEGMTYELSVDVQEI